MVLGGCRSFLLLVTTRICDADEGNLLKGKQYDQSRGNPASSG